MKNIDENIIKDLDPNKIDLNSRKYNQFNSLYCIAISILSYREESAIEKMISKINDRYNSNYKYIFVADKSSDTQLLILGCDKQITLTFRGTEFNKTKDIITDIKINIYQNSPEYQIDLKNLPAGHGGFRRAIINLILNQKVFQKLTDFCELFINKKETPIILTGHSLGGALSTLFIEPLVFSGFTFAMNYNFASPLAISRTELFKLRQDYKSKTFDIVNYRDYIPRASRKSRRKLGKIGEFYRIHKNGVLHKEEERYIKFTIAEKLNPKTLKKYHTSFGYYESLRKDINSTSKVNNRLL